MDIVTALDVSRYNDVLKAFSRKSWYSCLIHGRVPKHIKACQITSAFLGFIARKSHDIYVKQIFISLEQWALLSRKAWKNVSEDSMKIPNHDIKVGKWTEEETSWLNNTINTMIIDSGKKKTLSHPRGVVALCLYILKQKFPHDSNLQVIIDDLVKVCNLPTIQK